MIVRIHHIQKPVAYATMLETQDRLVAERLAGLIPDTVLFLEHLPVITLGRSTKPGHLLRNPDQLARMGIALARSPRGGDITYHAPGQVIMYPILKLEGVDADVHDYTRKLEEVAILTAADFGVPAFRRSGMTGVWTKTGKLAAIGVRIRRWVTSHGMSFNVNIDLSGFDAIVPCGLAGEQVTSLARILSKSCPSATRVRDRMAHHFSRVFNRRLRLFSA